MSNANEPIFPGMTATGMTKREIFSALALQGWLASFTDPDCSVKPSKCAEFAVECADALLAELERTHD